MGRRSKAEMMGLLERIFEMSSRDKLTIEQITNELQADGYDISRGAIQRSLKSSKEVAKLYQDTLTETKVLIDAVRENPNTDVIEVTSALMSGKLFEFVKGIDELEFKDAEGVSTAISRMAESQTKIARLRLTYQKGADAAKKAVLAALQAELKNHPDLLDRLTTIVATIEVAE